MGCLSVNGLKLNDKQYKGCGSVWGIMGSLSKNGLKLNDTSSARAVDLSGG